MICNFSVGQFVDVVDGVALDVQGLALHSLLVAEVGGQTLDSDGNLKNKQVVLKYYGRDPNLGDPNTETILLWARFDSWRHQRFGGSRSQMNRQSPTFLPITKSLF